MARASVVTSFPSTYPDALKKRIGDLISKVFSAPFGRTVRPAFGPALETASKWWLAGGINPANCVAAYQPKGAASYAASKINLANPGTYNAYEGSAPSWNSSKGWYFSTAARLFTGLTASASWSNYSVIARVIDVAQSTGYGRVFCTGDGVEFFALAWSVANKSAAGNVYSMSWNYVPFSTIGVAQRNIYRDGIELGIASDYKGNPSGMLTLGNYYSGTYALSGWIAVFALYNTTLSSGQMSSLHTAMMAL